MQTWECETCGHRWTAEVPPVPLSCPECGATHKVANRPGGIKPIRPSGG